MPHHVSKDDFEKLVEIALAELPPKFLAVLDDVPIDIRPRPTRKQLQSVGLADDELLLGLYVGTAMPDRSVDQGVRLPDVIFIFQEDIELVCDSADQLKDEIRTTVLHEIGHHYGLDEDQLEELGFG